MSMIDRSLDGMALLSGQLGALLKRRLREVGGIALISLAMMAALALATWSVQDPSLSHATDAPVHNLLGRPGAVAADLMMQLLGLGALALLLPIAVWGYRLLGHRPLSRERLRVLLWLFGAVLTAAFASCLPHAGHWPLPSGLGGVIGDAMLRIPQRLFGVPLAETYRMAAATVLGIAALVAFAGAAGLIWRDAPEEDAEDEPEDEDEAEDEDESAWISLGRLIHAVLSFRARLALLLGRAHGDANRRRAVKAPRRAASSRSSTRRSDLDGDEAAEDEEDAERAAARRAQAASRQDRAGSPAATNCRRSNLLTAPRAGERSTVEHRAAFARTRPRSKACSPISACAARSSTRGRARWSRSTSSSRRPASNPRASSALPTTSPAR